MPLSVRMGKREPFGETCGVPGFLRPSLDLWLEEVIEYGYLVGTEVSVDSAALHIARHLHLEGVRYWEDGPAGLRSRMRDGEVYLDVLDMLIDLLPEAALKVLEQYLWDVAHEYRVDFTNKRLVERVDETMYGMYERAVTPEDEASEHLRQAWLLTYGRDRDPGQAWNLASKAIEAVLGSIASPNDAQPTLGKMLSALRAEGNFVCRLPGKDSGDVTPLARFSNAVEIVHYAPGRHGGDGRVVDQHQSRTAVLQAVTVVSWLREGVLRRVDQLDQEGL